MSKYRQKGIASKYHESFLKDKYLSAAEKKYNYKRKNEIVIVCHGYLSCMEIMIEV